MTNKFTGFLYWILLTLVFSFFYIYKGHISEFKDLFLASLNPGKTIETTPGVIQVSIGQGGHFYLDTRINNVPVKFMVDTGASTICITKEIAHAVGIDVNKLVFNQIFKTANGVARGASAKLHSLKVGNYEIKDIHVSVSEGGLSMPLLGMSFLSTLKSYTFQGNTLYMRYDVK